MSTPNPGSIEAEAAGCICPVMDNNHGRWAPWPPDGWFIAEGCMVHTPLSGGHFRQDGDPVDIRLDDDEIHGYGEEE